MHGGAPWNKSHTSDTAAVVGTAVELSMLQHNMLFGSVGEASWHQRWHTKGSVFPFTVVCTCQNGVFCFFVVVLCAPPAHWPCCSAAPQRPLVELGSIAAFACMCGNMCVCVVQDPQHFLSYSLSLTHTLIQTQLFSSGQYFLLSKTIHQLGAFFLESQNQIFPVNIFAIIWTCCTRGPN